MEFRSLRPEEIEPICGPDYAASGNPLPDPRYSTFLGAFNTDGSCVAYLCLQIKLHAQPLVIRDGWARVLPGLVAAAEAHILSTAGPQWVYLFAPAGKLSALAQSLGMQMEPWVVLSKLVQPPIPEKFLDEIQPIQPLSTESIQ